jgi:hypothetical protein
MANAKHETTTTVTQAAPPALKRRRPAPKTDAEENLGVRFLSRIDPDEDFSDVSGSAQSQFALENEQSDRHYHYASQVDIGDYKTGVVPYRIEHATKGGVAVRAGTDAAEGETIVSKGLILISCDKEKWQKRNRYNYVKTLKNNEREMKRLQRDRVIGADNDEELEMRGA